MQPLSQHLSELSAQAKKAEERASRAQSETKERLDRQLDEAREEAQAALDRVNKDVASASEGTKNHFDQLKSKVDADMQRMRENREAREHKVEAWQANNYANDKTADAQAAIGYAIAAVKVAEVATLDAIDARARAEIKADQVEPIQG